MTAIAQVLLAHPEARVTRSYRAALEPHGFAVTVAADGPTACSMMALRRYELVLMALWLPGCDVPGLVQELRQGEASPEVMIIDDDVFSEAVVEILRLGAYDVVSAETSSSELVLRSERAVSSQRRDREFWLLKREAERAPFAGPVIQASGKIQTVLRKLMTVAPARASVLLLGETGTGKGLMAKTLHRYSGRHPFLAVNCGGFQESLFESELFGHRRGAFTGAVDHKPGLFEAAHGGTLFLDEIGELQPALQAKLLQVLDSGEIRPIGATSARKVDVRLVAATNVDLEDQVATGRFRQDLFFRLNVVAIRMPPLRERPEDIPLLLQHYLERFHVPGSPRKRFSAEAFGQLESYAWPGNVRELANVVETASLLTAGPVIGLDDLPLAPKALATPMRLRPAELPLPLAEVERRHILAVLDHTRGHRGRAAHLLGIDVKTLGRKLRTYETSNRRSGELPDRQRNDPAN
jgi:DNA-binding NtrC family response regulator